MPGGIVASRNGFSSLTVQKNQPNHALFLTHMNSRMILRLRVLHASPLLLSGAFAKDGEPRKRQRRIHFTGC
jgi:hypothetical protein